MLNQPSKYIKTSLSRLKLNHVKRTRERYSQKENLRRANDPLDLQNFEQKTFSQGGEDGIIAEIFRRINFTNRYFVEFGVQNGSENNTRYLLETQKWSGLWIEGSETSVDRARKLVKDAPVTILNRFITKENISSIFSEAQVPKEFDLLSIDIDGNDYWVWKELKAYSPRVVIIEYNASYLPPKKWVMPYNPDHEWSYTNYYGASLTSLAELAKQKGYTLVGCNSSGVNAFFIRSDLVRTLFSQAEAGPSYHYTYPKFNETYRGHPPHRKDILKNLVISKAHQVESLQAWAAEKEKNTQEMVASLNEHLAYKDKELTALQSLLAQQEQQLATLNAQLDEKADAIHPLD